MYYLGRRGASRSSSQSLVNSFFASSRNEGEIIQDETCFTPLSRRVPDFRICGCPVFEDRVRPRRLATIRRGDCDRSLPPVSQTNPPGTPQPAQPAASQ